MGIKQSNVAGKIDKIYDRIGFKNIFVIIFVVFIWIVFSIFTHGMFLTARNISFIILQATIVAYIAMGMVFVIVSGNIDLSTGSVVGLTGAIVAILQFGLLKRIALFSDVSEITITVVAIFITLVFGALVGVWQGSWIAYGRVPSFIVTLGGMLLFRGAVLGVTQGITISPLLSSFKILGEGYLPKFAGDIIAIFFIFLLWANWIFKRKVKVKYKLASKFLVMDIVFQIILTGMIVLITVILNMYRGVPIPVALMLFVALILGYISKNTSFGRNVYAIGGDMEASRLSGINVRLNLLLVFVLMGVLSSVSGIILTARLDAATTNAGSLFELSAIAACVIGGTSLFGGVGSISGAVIGSLVIASIDNGMSMVNVKIFWQYMIKGMILIVIVWLDVNFQARNRKRKLGAPY